MARKRKLIDDAAVAAERRPLLRTYTLRLEENDVELLGKLVERTKAKGSGEVLRTLIRRAAKELGLD